MKINSLYLENFKTITKLDLQFNKKIILLEGNAGQGKTSILEAIVYMLTGDLNEKIAEFKRDSIHDFLIKGNFDHLGHNYKIEINSTKAGANKKLIIDNDESNIYKNSDATKRLSEIINPTITKYSAVSEQGQSTLLLFQKPAERLRQFKEILGIDNIGNIVEQIKKDIKDNNDKVKIIDTELQILKNKTFILQEIPEIVDNEEELKSQIELLTKDKEIFEVQNKLYEKFIDEINDYNLAQENIKRIKKDSECDLVLINKKKSDLKQVPKFDDNLLFKLQEDLNKIEKEKIKYDNELSKYKDAQNKISSLQRKNEQLNKDIQKYEFIKVDLPIYNLTILEEKKNLLNDIALKIREENKSLILAKKGFCPNCGQVYVADIGIIEKNIEVKNTEFNSLKIEIQSIEKILKDYNEKIQKNTENRIKRESIEDVINENQKQIEDLNLINKLEEKQFNTNNYNQQIEEQKRLKKEFNEATTFNKKILDEITRIENGIERSKQTIIDLNQIQKPKDCQKPKEFDNNLFEKIKTDLIILQQKKQEIGRIKKHNADIELEKRKSNTIVRQKEKETEEYWKENRILEDCKNVLDKDFSSFVIDRGCNFIKEKMNELFRRAYGRYEVTFKQDKNSIDFFYNSVGGIPRPVTMASGFEKQVLAICCRLALCSLQNLGILFGDEIDSEAGTEDSLKMLNVLFNEQKFNQYFIITHKDDVKEWIEQRDDCQKISLRHGCSIN